jgi:hypothetical protein
LIFHEIRPERKGVRQVSGEGNDGLGPADPAALCIFGKKRDNDGKIFFKKGPLPLTRIPEVEEFNTLCRKCRRTCRQPAGALLIDCPRFFPFPFKVDRHRYDQLELFNDKT